MLKRTANSVHIRGVSATLALAPAVVIETAAAIVAGPVRRRFAKRIGAEAIAPLSPSPPIDVAAASFTQESDVPELVVSIRSFLSHVGVPREFVVVSDGTITEESKALIRSIRPGLIEVRSVEEYAGSTVPEIVKGFMEGSPWAGKLASLIALGERAPALFVDSDVMWFENASEFRALCRRVPLFLLDVGPHLEPRMLPDQALRDVEVPVNSGILYVPEPLDWTLGLSRLALLNGELPKYSEQTAVHLTMHDAGGEPLPPDRYIVSPLRTRPHVRIRSGQVCARHYTRPQRGLFWLQVARSRRAARSSKRRRD
jgi:hypothetical protein